MSLTGPGNYPPSSERVTVRRLAKRGHYDPATIHQILDAGFICHVGFLIDGQPRVIPTAYVRIDDAVYLHGSPSNQMLRALVGGGETCVCVTHIDGLVLARSAFHHSINYRSVVLFGPAREISDPGEKAGVLEALSEQIIPRRWPDIRPPTPAELQGTLVVGIHIDEASAKIRNGPPKDDEEDYALPIWAGVVPLRTVAGEPICDPRLPASIATPPHLLEYIRNLAAGRAREPDAAARPVTSRDLIERYYHDLWNRFDKRLIPELLTDDFQFRGSLGQTKSGHAEFGEYVDFVRAAFPDFTNRIDEVVCEGDRAFARLTYRGTHRGALFGIPPTDRTIEYAGAASFCFKGDKIAAAWVLGDVNGLLEQLRGEGP